MSFHDEMLTTAEVAKKIKRSTAYVRGLCDQNKLRHTRLADRGHYLIFADSVDELLAAIDPTERSESFYERESREALEAVGYLLPSRREQREPAHK